MNITTDSILLIFGVFTFAAGFSVSLGTIVLVAYFNQKIRDLEKEYEKKIDEINASNKQEIDRLKGQLENLRAILQGYPGIPIQIETNPNEFAPPNA